MQFIGDQVFVTPGWFGGALSTVVWFDPILYGSTAPPPTPTNWPYPKQPTRPVLPGYNSPEYRLLQTLAVVHRAHLPWSSPGQ